MSYGFYFDMTTCTGCRTCQISCKDKNDLPIGALFRQVRTFETGEFPRPGFYHLSSTCNHCTEPACTKICPTGAMYKNEETGKVLHNDEECIGCQSCAQACPYSVPQYFETDKIVRKCDLCDDLTSNGGNPVCVDACIMRCLEWGDVDELRQKHPDAVSTLAVFPDDATGPNSIVDIKASASDDQFVQKFI